MEATICQNFWRENIYGRHYLPSALLFLMLACSNQNMIRKTWGLERICVY